ncbi:BadF/BadG/BcrA/BcrD ATPase family protein [Geosporobacter ferrireducens]|uniref:ATPase BadF/BadG/BcrA/BcrD type domain-containing protein n=1 Tax=Geosporobacter ferrireducens TaxID=1424294 RepID=A0A1D8GNL2_9FIRM|nr:BadF/BadG/BcrA/BcrD ATPase family protein [Geosporobacter ferrireducens]AOT72452.1 hypothetical protein Gferi_24615 [Geosporobacter ferrireducens]
MDYLIGIDAGGTKSELIAYDMENKPIFKKNGGFGNPAVNQEKTLKNLELLIKQVLKALDIRNCKLIAIGLAGAQMGNSKEFIKSYFNDKFNIPTIVLNDILMSYQAYLGSGNGIMTIAGTGSSSYGRRNDREAMAGGWGHLLGDEGSGYHIVLEAFKKMIYLWDREIPLDELSRALLKEIDMQDPSGIKHFIYNSQKNEIAGLFPIILNMSQKGSSEAEKLLIEAGKSLADITGIVYNRLNFNEQVQIGIKGGIFHSSCYVKESFENRLSEYMSDFIIIKEDISVTKAVCSLYKQIR